MQKKIVATKTVRFSDRNSVHVYDNWDPIKINTNEYINVIRKDRMTREDKKMIAKINTPDDQIEVCSCGIL